MSDNQRDYYAEGYDAAKANHSDRCPDDVEQAGQDAIDQWYAGYQDYCEDESRDLDREEYGKL